MDRPIDYVLWTRDIPISYTGFKDADAEVLCILSYYDLAPVFETEREKYTVRDMQVLLENGAPKVEITGGTKGFEEFLTAVVNSKRFGELEIRDYVNIFRHEPPLQFSAVTFRGDDGMSFIAYRGTDNSLAGWKEDFMISFTRTQAQEEALKYARERFADGGRWKIGGHSKGGNLVLYVGSMLGDEELESLEHVYVLDGPGFCPNVIDPKLIDRINDRTTRIIPEYSVVGKLFEPMITNTKIVYSTDKGFMQHSPLGWGIDHGDLAIAKKNDPESDMIHKAVDGWINEMSLEDRTVFVNELFDSLEAGGADTFTEIQEGGANGLRAIVRKLWAASKTTKHALREFTKYAMQGKFEEVKDDIAAKLLHEEADSNGDGKISVKEMMLHMIGKDKPEEESETEEESKAERKKLSAPKVKKQRIHWKKHEDETEEDHADDNEEA